MNAGKLFYCKFQFASIYKIHSKLTTFNPSQLYQFNHCNRTSFFQKRFYSDKPPGSRYVKPVTKNRLRIVDKYEKLVSGYESFLEKKFPRTFRIYQVFVIGTRELYRDIKEYLRISQDLRNHRTVRSLSYSELEKYFQTPKDMKKVAPVLLIAVLPFANYVVFPVAYMFPKHLLCQHYWSLQQKIDFAMADHKTKLYIFRSVFRHLQRQVESIQNETLKENFRALVYKLGSGVHPSVEEILQVKDLFIDGPYALTNLKHRHLKRLCQLHGLPTYLGKRSRLWNHAGFIKEMDLAMSREGLSTLNMTDLRRACFLRGLNPMTLPTEEIVSWLDQWITITMTLDRNSLSMLLHCPIFLGYNAPSNWVLTH